MKHDGIIATRARIFNMLNKRDRITTAMARVLITTCIELDGWAVEVQYRYSETDVYWWLDKFPDDHDTIFKFTFLLEWKLFAYMIGVANDNEESNNKV